MDTDPLKKIIQDEWERVLKGIPALELLAELAARGWDVSNVVRPVRRHGDDPVLGDGHEVREMSPEERQHARFAFRQREWRERTLMPGEDDEEK